MPLWRNWLTRTTQNRVTARSCGFDSHQRHLEDYHQIHVPLRDYGFQNPSTVRPAATEDGTEEFSISPSDIDKPKKSVIINNRSGVEK